MRNIWHDIDPHAITPTHFTAVIEIPAGSKKKYELDKKTGLPNREKLNVYITGMADRILPEDYTCFALQLDNLPEMSRRFGYHVGDGILRHHAL